MMPVRLRVRHVTFQILQLVQKAKQSNLGM